MRKTFRNLRPGDRVELRHEGYRFPVEFVGFSADREYAEFKALSPDGTQDYTFKAYRFNGRWAAGSSATPITVAQDN